MTTKSAEDKAAEAAAEAKKASDKAGADAAAEAAENSPEGLQGNLGHPDETKETPPVARPGTPDKPAAAGNASEIPQRSDSGPNQMSTAGLTLAQRARVEGTPLTGNLAQPGYEGANEAVAAADRFGGKYDEDGKVRKSFKDRAAADERAREKAAKG